MNDPDAIDELLADQPEVLTLDEVRELLRVSNNTVLKWQREHHLKVIVLGERLRRVRKSDLRTFLIRADEIDEAEESNG